MRPVVRGNAVVYDPNTKAIRSAITNTRLALQAIRELRAEIAVVDGAMTENDKYKRAKKAVIQAVTQKTLDSLVKDAVILRNVFKAAEALNNEALINTTGAQLLANLKRQSDLLEGYIDNKD